MRMREWFHETHGPTFELLRHFLLRFFDSDLVTSPGQTALAIIGSSVMFVSWFPFFAGPLKDKYNRLAALADPEPYRIALRADHLWLITMLMAAVGLLTCIKWQSLFPSLTDYRAIGWMPVRARQLFGAKLGALLIVATGAIAVLDVLPCVIFASLSRSPVVPFLSIVITGSYFIFFALVAVQGLLLNVLSPRRFRGVTGSVQAILAALMVVALVLSFSIGPPVARHVRPGMARYAGTGLQIAVLLTLCGYVLSYRRYQRLMLEGGTSTRKDHRWVAIIFDWIVPNPRQQAIMVFLAKGILGNGPHRMLLMAYLGFGLAVAGFVSPQVSVLAFLLIGLRHLFSIPVELRANWTFRITEGEGRLDWIKAIDRFALLIAAILLLLSHSALFIMFGLAAYEAVFRDWEKLPFTCSYLPGKKPVWMVTLQLFALLVSLPAVNAILDAASHNRLLYSGLFAALAVFWLRSFRARRENWESIRLLYDEAPDPAVHSLNLLRN